MNHPKYKVYHSAYGLPDSMRVAALDLADVRGVKFAAKRFNIGRSTLYRWRHDMAHRDDNNVADVCGHGRRTRSTRGLT